MTDHIKFFIDRGDNRFEADVFQGAYDEIVVSVTNTIYNPETRRSIMYSIPVRKNDEFVWKVNKASVSSIDGSAETLIKLFKEFDAYARSTVNKLIIDNPNKDKLLAWK